MYYYDRDYQGKKRMKTLRGLFLRYIAIFIGILIIASLFQFGVWVKGPEILQSVILIMADETESFEKTLEYFGERLGMDRPFIPDLWPFDNTSIWR